MLDFSRIGDQDFREFTFFGSLLVYKFISINDELHKNEIKLHWFLNVRKRFSENLK